MNVSMGHDMVTAVERLYHQSNNPSVQLGYVRLLTDWYESALKKDKFVRKTVRAAIFKLNRSYAEGYLKSQS